MQSLDGKEFYAIDKKVFREARIKYYDILGFENATDKEGKIPQIEGWVFEKKEDGKYHIGEEVRIIRFDEMKGALIQLS